MREFSKISPKFWIGPTGKKIRALGPQAQVVALYLLSSPHANMLGVYHLPIAYISADTGSPFEGASKALQSLCEAGFCAYDEDTEMVFVYEMAKYQIGDQLHAADNLVKSIHKELKTLPKSILLNQFHEKYKAAYHLEDTRPFEGPSKPLRSREIEREIETEREKEISDSADTLYVGEETKPSRSKRGGFQGGEMRETKNRSAPAPSPKASFDFLTGKFVGIPETNIQSWITAYPAIDVRQELAKAAAWLMSNPQNRKSDYLRFLNKWLSRAQDDAGRLPRASKPEKFDPTAYVNRTGKYAQQPHVIDISDYTGSVANGSAMAGK